MRLQTLQRLVERRDSRRLHRGPKTRRPGATFPSLELPTSRGAVQTSQHSWRRSTHTWSFPTPTPTQPPLKLVRFLRSKRACSLRVRTPASTSQTRDCASTPPTLFRSGSFVFTVSPTASFISFGHVSRCHASLVCDLLPSFALFSPISTSHFHGLKRLPKFTHHPLFPLVTLMV